LVMSTTAVVSVSNSGGVGNAESTFNLMSVDGRYVAFNSTCTNLDAKDTDSSQDVYVRDMQSNKCVLVSVGINGKALGTSFLDGISRNGRYVLFRTEANASQVVSGLVDGGGSEKLFLRDIVAGTTTCVGMNAANTATANSSSYVEGEGDM